VGGIRPAARAGRGLRALSAPVRIGTCSWADETLTKTWYPASVRTAEARLHHYAEHFDTVEVNASYYALPGPDATAAWARRTPRRFVFHVKAFGMMTRHPVRAEQLPPDLRGEAPVDERGRVDHPSRELRAEVFTRFRAALEPLREAGKLGGILMQFPSYVTLKPASLQYLEWAKERLGGDEMMVEFRHRSWLEPENAPETLAFLRSLGATYVMVDAPRTAAKNLVPTVVATTSPTAYLRLHGRNAATWNVRGRSAAERFDYLYSRDELGEWTEPLRELSSLSEHTYVMFNNNGRSAGPDGPIAQAPTNAEMLRDVLRDAGVAVTDC
jgi:uncharacterized protein YecE (DUF72 family)